MKPGFSHGGSPTQAQYCLCSTQAPEIVKFNPPAVVLTTEQTEVLLKNISSGSPREKLIITQHESMDDLLSVLRKDAVK